MVFAGRGRRAARAAANPALWPNLMPRRPGWRRHVPPVLLLLALASLLVGVARPQALMASDQKQTTVVLAVDSSNSMAAKDVDPSRIAAARTAARDLIAGLPVNAKLGLVSFARDVQVLQAPTDDRAAFSKALAHLTLRGGTTLGTAIDRAVASLRGLAPGAQGAGDHRDLGRQEHRGHPLADRSGARGQGRGRARVHGLARHRRRHRHGAGQDRQRAARPDDAAPRRRRQRRALLPRHGRQGAAATPTATSAAPCEPQHKKRDISFAFVGGAMALVAGGSLLSLAWFRRLL